MLKWMLFKSKSNGQAYFFNGEWPISVSPNSSVPNRVVWNAAENREVMDIIKKTSDDVPHLNLILESTKRTFTHDNEKYVILERGQL